MEIIIYNIGWMIYNILLALISVAAGFTILQLPWKVAKICFGVVWFFFLPNTLYMITDLIHLPQQWTISSLYQPLLLTEYGILILMAIVTYILAMYPLEVLINNHIKKKVTKKKLIIFFNITVAFAMVLGRVERVNSWDVILSPFRLLQDVVHAVTSKEQLLLLVCYGIIVNCIYFSFQHFFLLLDGKKR